MDNGLDANCKVDPIWMQLYGSLPAGNPHWSPPPGLARLTRWPDLMEVPDELLLPVARISALLWKKPTASHLINRILGGEGNENARTLQMLEALGYVEFISAAQAPSARLTVASEPYDDVAKAQNMPTGLRAFIGQLRQRLLG